MATAFRATRVGWAVLGLCGLVLLAAGCGSSAYNEQLDATAAELRQGQPAEPAAEEEDPNAEANAIAQEMREDAERANSERAKDGAGYGSPAANSLLAPP